MARRSVLFTPGDRPDMMRKTADSGADVVVFDLEDAVAPGDKEEARAAVRDILTDPSVDPSAEVLVRTNPVGRSMDADLDVLPSGAEYLDGFMLPKVTDRNDVETAARMLEEHDLPPRVLSLVETAAGVLDVEAIASAAPTDAVVFGAEDLAADIGASRTAEGTEVLYARERVVLAAAAAGVDAIDTVYTDYEDDEGLEAEARFASQLGFDGKLAIHPAQVGPINRAFTPDQEEVEWARRVLAASEESEAGVFAVDGEMIDAPLLERAERILSRAEAANSS